MIEGSLSLQLKRLVQVLMVFFPSSWRVFVLRRVLGYRVGKRVQLGLMSFVVVDDMELGDDVVIDPLTFIYGLKKLSMGDRGRIAVFSKIYGSGELEMGPRTLISVNCLVECHEGRRVVMEDFSCFGPQNTIYTHGEYLPILQGYPDKRDDVVIQSYSWTGINASILPGTEIGGNTIIAPGAVLTGVIASNSFIKPRSYEYSISPIKDKLAVRTKKEIRNFIYNAIDSIIRRKKIENEELFLSDNLSEVLVLEGHRIKYWQEGFQKSPQEREIIVGYDLPAKIKSDKDCGWLDFSNYRYSGGSAIVLSLAEKLFSNYNLRFIEMDNDEKL